MTKKINIILDDLLDKVSTDLDFLKDIKIIKNSRERQDKINRATKLCRHKKKKIFNIMEKHIENLHEYILTQKNLDYKLIKLMSDYNEESKKIKNIKNVNDL